MNQKKVKYSEKCFALSGIWTANLSGKTKLCRLGFIVFKALNLLLFLEIVLC